MQDLQRVQWDHRVLEMGDDSGLVEVVDVQGDTVMPGGAEWQWTFGGWDSASSASLIFPEVVQCYLFISQHGPEIEDFSVLFGLQFSEIMLVYLYLEIILLRGIER